MKSFVTIKMLLRIKKTYGAIRYLLLLGSGLVGCIGCAQKSNEPPFPFSTAYVEYKGEVSSIGHIQQVRRQLFVSEMGRRRLVISNFVQLFDMGSYNLSASRKLLEYRINDSIYSFDSADSTLVVVGLTDLKLSENKLFEFSGEWLLRSLMSETNPGQNQETVKFSILGLPCSESMIEDKIFFMHQGLPLGVRFSSAGLSQNEQSVKYKADTVFSGSCFQFPTGFRRLRPSK